MFIDTAKLHVQAGKGGDGCLSFRREKYIPKGGPDGGDGGRGGHVIFRASASINTLLAFRHQPLLRAQDGGAGMGRRMHGADGEDSIVRVPPGTIVYDKDTGEHLGSVDLPASPGGNPVTYLHEGKQYLVVAVGSGGRNAELLALTLP